MTEDLRKFLEKKTFTVLWYVAIVRYGQNKMIGVALVQLVDVCLADRDGLVQSGPLVVGTRTMTLEVMKRRLIAIIY